MMKCEFCKSQIYEGAVKISISYTANESITVWNYTAVAHALCAMKAKDYIKSGLAEAQDVASMISMLEPQQ